LMAVPATTSPQLKLGDAVALFSGSDANVTLARGFDSFHFAIMPDKERFIAVQNLSPRKDQEIAVIENWVEILE
jgi:hypothetical protein